MAYYLTGVVPAALAMSLGLLLLLHVPIFHEREFYFLPQILRRYVPIAIIYIAFVLAAWKAVSRISNRSIVLAAFPVFLFALLPRMTLLWVFRGQILPFSDFLWSWDVAQGAREGYSFVAHLPFPAYQVWAFAEYLITRALPNGYASILFCNALVDSLNAAVVVYLVGRIGRAQSVGVLAGLLYGLFPPAIMYCTVGTPEHIAILLNLLGMACLVDCFDDDAHLHRQCIAGVLFGFSSSLKSFSAVIILSYLVTDLLCTRKRAGRRMREWALIVFVTFMTKQAILFATSRWLGTDLSQYSHGVLYHQMLVGLNTEGEGQIHLGTLSHGFWDRFMENGNDSAAAGEYAKGLLIGDWRQHYAQIPKLLLQKIVWAWQDDLIPIKYFLENTRPGGSCQKILGAIRTLVPCVSQVMYIGLAGTGMLRVVSPESGEDINKKELFFSMIVFGFFCLLLVIEAQSRYKCLVLPLICVQAALGIDSMGRILSRRSEDGE